MLDEPRGTEILQAVSQLMRDVLIPQLPPDAAFQARVAANALDLVRREMELGPALEREGHQRLAALLGHGGDARQLESELCARIRAGSIDAKSPELIEHLMLTTLAKMAIDQPGYASYRRTLESRGDPLGKEPGTA